MKLHWGEQTGIDPGPFPHESSAESQKEFWKKFSQFNHSFVYENECPRCSTINRCYTQQDHNPEYHAEIYIECRYCLEKILFMLPVN